MCSLARLRCGWSGRSGSLAPGLRVRASWSRARRLQRGPGEARVLPILRPSVGGMGIEIVAGSGEAPWNRLRANGA